ncbi:hypothetical protein BDP27DRAFT_1404732 [Rhodocollybia butyracea]|uniref:Uncharacterized protein n=1 Tax=Rhodocollybia butyracea TaxID=206335 RepID=A0A9P5PLS5_9AGAR|nr:hypothetical protein BDP27DRAFT_1404732 [Rhodocollybia butyracea]
MISVSKLPLALVLSVLLCTCFLASTPIQVNCSPLPAPGNPTTNPGKSKSLTLSVHNMDNEKIHVSLIMGNVVLKALPKEMDDLKSPLVGNRNFATPPDLAGDGLISLDADAEFPSPKEFSDEIQELSTMTMNPFKPTEKGGNYADYVKKVLEKLVSDRRLVSNQKKLKKVPEKFTTWYNKNYEKVSEGTRLKHEKEEHK